MPERGGRVITLEDLARHRSALPRLPFNLDAGTDPKNPYAAYTVNQLYEFLSGYTLTRDIGAEFEYSNLAAACWVMSWHWQQARIMKPLSKPGSAVLSA